MTELYPEAQAVQAALAQRDQQIASLEYDLEHALDPPAPALVTGSSLGVALPRQRRPRWGRAYLQPGEQPVDYRADTGLRKVVDASTEGVWMSFKSDPGDWLVSLVTSIREDGLDVIVTHKHEPENDGMSPAQVTAYQDGWHATDSLLDGQARPGVRTASVLMGSGVPSSWDVYYPEVGVDLCGFDRYNPGIQTAKKYVDPATVFNPVIAYAASLGVPLAIGETGTNIVAGDAAGRAKWAADARALLAASGCPVALWWNQGKCALDEATAQAWLD